MTISDKKLAANRRNARKGGRFTRAFDAETDRMAAEVLARADARKAKAVAKKLLAQIEAGNTPAPAVPTNVAKATDDVDSLVGQLIEYAGVKALADVQWRQVYDFAKKQDLEGRQIRTDLFLRWQSAQPLPDIPGWEN